MTSPVLRFEVLGTPVPMARPRVTRNGSHTFTPAPTTAWRDAVRLAWQQSGSPRLPDAPLYVELTFVFARPPSHYGTKGKLSAAGRRAIPGGTADLSNLAKNIEDALNGLAWTDDRFITLTSAEKVWGPTPCARVLCWAPSPSVTRPSAKEGG